MGAQDCRKPEDSAPPTEAELNALRAADPANLIMGGVSEREKLEGIDAYVNLTLNYARR